MVYFIDRKGNTKHIDEYEQDKLRIVGEFRDDTSFFVSFSLVNGLTVANKPMRYETYAEQNSWFYELEDSEKMRGITKFQFMAKLDEVVVATGRGLIRREYDN